MKIFLTLFIVLTICSFNSYGQTKSKKKQIVKYDPALAKKLGADEYGMKNYVFAMLKSGSSKFDDAKRQELINGHLKNIGRLANEGKLIMAGPFMDDQNWRGIFIFNVKTVEEAQKLVETDPAIKAGVFEVELHPWYGSAVLPEIMKMHSKVQKNSF